MIKLLLQLSPNIRPNTSILLNHDYILKRTNSINSLIPITTITNNLDDNILINTIRLSKNFQHLEKRLPKAS